ncbi:unnamed protein product [Ectocarpus sp. 12 AP-2014]
MRTRRARKLRSWWLSRRQRRMGTPLLPRFSEAGLGFCKARRSGFGSHEKKTAAAAAAAVADPLPRATYNRRTKTLPI